MITRTKAKVTLLTHTASKQIPAKAAKFCTSGSTVDEIMQPDPKDDDILARVLNVGHRSVIEHFSATFGISGVSRVTEVQLVRHRVASYSIKSGRYTTAGETFEVAIPDSLRQYDQQVDEMINGLHHFYLNAVANGVPAEDARYILPQATATQIMVTMNARELLHFFGERTCTRAQWEIRGVAEQMLAICKQLAPVIFNGAGPKCGTLGYCPEAKSRCCGRRPHKLEVLGME